MGVIGSIEDLARSLLLTCLNVAHPVIRKDLVESRSLLRIDLQHSADDVPTFPRQDAEKSPGTLDNFLALTLLLGARREGRSLFAGGASRFFVIACLAGLFLGIFAGGIAFLGFL